MNLKKLNAKLEKDPLYIFCIKHKKIINIIQGLVVIGLLIAINIYVVKDHFIKKQIAEHCGYIDSTYKCVCEKHYVEEWEILQANPTAFKSWKVNLSSIKNDS